MPRSAALLVFAAACRTAAGTPQPYVATDGAMTGAAAGVPADEISVTATALRSDAGTVRCYLYDAADGFPDAKTHVVAAAVALPKARAATCRFTQVAAHHDYAIVILHDENNDAVFQKGMLGIPLEGYGFSNNARARFSAPSFEDCRVRYGAGPLALAIAMQY
ncbi:MAG: DUF2141 domain-containing protein [Deltaproteobacteria bacterium]|nr:DUF2141 domain-containing protein [Deltaproteobacteria bacterium]